MRREGALYSLASLYVNALEGATLPTLVGVDLSWGTALPHARRPTVSRTITGDGPLWTHSTPKRPKMFVGVSSSGLASPLASRCPPGSSIEPLYGVARPVLGGLHHDYRLAEKAI